MKLQRELAKTVVGSELNAVVDLCHHQTRLRADPVVQAKYTAVEREVALENRRWLVRTLMATTVVYMLGAYFLRSLIDP